jgi:hypothetical protein
VRLIDVEEIDAHILEGERLILGFAVLAFDAALHLLDLLLDLGSLVRPSPLRLGVLQRGLKLGHHIVDDLGLVLGSCRACRRS